MNHLPPTLLAVRDELIRRGELTVASSAKELIGAGERVTGIHAAPSDDPALIGAKWFVALGLGLHTEL